MVVSKRAQQMPPFLVMEILEKAQELEAAGRTIIHMEIGEPDFPTPPVIKAAGERALAADKTRYTHSLGLPELREAIARSYRKKYHVKVEADRVVVTQGTSPAMLLLFGAILDDGDEVILSNPGYACYPNFVRFAGGTPSFVYVREEDGFQPHPEAVAANVSRKTKAILVNSPGNPAGTLLPTERMSEIADLAADDRLIISDEIYHGMVYGGQEHSILEFTDRAVVINGFSKLYAMTGWRMGYLIVPPELIRPLQKLQQNTAISANSFVQWAAIAALTQAHDDVRRMVATYDERRRYLVPRLRELGFGIAVEPTGAFYVLANAGHLSDNSYELALELLTEAGVAVTPGIDFGDGAEGFIRFSYANSLGNLKEGCRRLEQYLSGRRANSKAKVKL